MGYEEDSDDDEDNDPLLTHREKEIDEYSLSFVVDFAPLRPFEGNVNLIIQEKNGGVWKFVLQLVATTPDIDDSIEILSVIGKMKRMSFRLSNIFSFNSNFEAYFTPESSLNFLVHPEKGILPSKGYEGQQFIVSYQANSYGKLSKGVLIIDTMEMQWRFKVTAVLPKLPKLNARESKIVSKIDNRLSYEVLQKRNLKAKRNNSKSFVEDNRSRIIKASKKKKKRRFGK